MHFVVLLLRLFALCSLSAGFSIAQADDVASTTTPLTVERVIKGGLQYLESTQVKETRGDLQSRGEWSSAMTAEHRLVFYSKKKAAYDSNLFSTVWTHNLLAEIYLRDPSLSMIPPMLNLAMETIPSYREGDAFRFWQTDFGPTQFELAPGLTRYAANLFPDADDTAVTYTAEWLYEKITGKIGIPKLPQKIGPIFAQWRDQKRKNFSLYEILVSQEFQTGAYLTWLGQEQAALQLRYMPEPHKHNMPFGENDVDCVVNTNVLVALTERGELDTPGYEHACNLINRAFRHGRQGSCGVYYPNHYQLHAAIARATSLGVSCLDESKPLALSEILKRQRKDGSWLGTPYADDIDITTAFALGALAELGDPSDPKQIAQAQRGVEYLLGSVIEMPDGRAHWANGAFFRGVQLFERATPGDPKPSRRHLRFRHSNRPKPLLLRELI